MAAKNQKPQKTQSTSRSLLVKQVIFVSSQAANAILQTPGSAWNSSESPYDICYKIDDGIYLVYDAQGFLVKCFHPDKVMTFVPMAQHKVTIKEIPFDRGQVKQMLAQSYITKSTAAQLVADVSGD